MKAADYTSEMLEDVKLFIKPGNSLAHSLPSLIKLRNMKLEFLPRIKLKVQEVNLLRVIFCKTL